MFFRYISFLICTRGRPGAHVARDTFIFPNGSWSLFFSKQADFFYDQSYYYFFTICWENSHHKKKIRSIGLFLFEKCSYLRMHAIILHSKLLTVGHFFLKGRINFDKKRHCQLNFFLVLNFRYAEFSERSDVTIVEKIKWLC